MDMIMDALRLYNGVEIPRIGFGPGHINRGAGNSQLGNRIGSQSIVIRAWNKIVVRQYYKLVLERKRHTSYINSIASGIRAGFKLIDYSAAYGSGRNIANAIAISGVPREQLFLTCRISNGAQFAGAQAVRDLIKRHLDEYGTDYVDVMMFHWPVTDCFENTWRVICEAYDNGIARSIGVANCHPHHVKKLIKCGLKPMLNQFEIHPLFTQKDLIKYNQDLGIVVEAYTPIARNDDRLMRLPKLRQIASNHGKTPVQVVLRWHMQQNIIPIIRSLNYYRQKENLDVFDFELTSEEMKIIDGFNIDSRLRYHPDNCDFTIL